MSFKREATNCCEYGLYNSLGCTGVQKPGFCQNTSLQLEKIAKNPVSLVVMRRQQRTRQCRFPTSQF